MRSYLPDLNVWLALSDKRHLHHEQAWRWARALEGNYRLLLVRHTQLGILRLLTSQAAMGDDVITLKAAWKIYDRWMEDSSVEFVPEPENLDRVFRRIAATFSQDFATKVVVDCYLLALANDLHATLLTFDRGLLRLAKLHGCSAATPSE